MLTGGIAAAAVIAVVGVHTPAVADPDPLPPGASEELREYRELVAEAEQLNEAHLEAQDDLEVAERELEQAEADLEAAERSEREALAEQREYRHVVDAFASASYTNGAEVTTMSALLAGQSTQDYLERSTALDVLAADQNEAMERLSSAVEQASVAQRDAEDAATRAEQARETAEELVVDIEARQATLDERIEEVREAAGLLTDEDQQMHQSEGADAPSQIVAPGAAAQQAVDAAMGKRGSPYEWGADGPDRFDCSGLTSWAYQQAGISIPRSSRAQSTHGQPIPRDQLQPGDLVFFYEPVSHVGIYVGDGKMVHAPQQGDVVKVAEMMEGDFSGARRVA
ncbi:NlpC/P60 family protein [Haloechinothrix sp. LS1_15]|nr:NlpC/P60 family protein [Haloechinothrix sp. LS1_15]